MTDVDLKQLDLERHARGLRRAAETALPVALCDDTAAPITISALGESAMRAALAETGGELPAPDGLVGRLEFGTGPVLLYTPVAGRGGSLAAFLAVLLDESAASAPSPRLEEALADAAAGIATEFALSLEATSLADELSQRYEELNLVYSLESQSLGLDAGSLGAKNLLASFVELLDVEVAAFVGSKSLSAFAIHPRRSLPNLDFVLTKLNTDVLRFVAASRKPLILNEMDDPRRAFLFVNVEQRLLAVPVLREGVIESALVLLRSQDQREFSNGDRNLATVIAGQTALMVRNQGMLASLQRFSEQIAGALISAVEAKDPYTRGHSERVQEISRRIGKAAELGSQEVEDISWGALLHDIGKIGIPDSVLCKVDQLTEDEFTLIKIHPERSYEILRQIESLGEAAALAARYHQERFDGKGYPSGLRADQIPVHARVIAVADTYDAITSSRAYRAGQDHRTAMSEIARVAGTQLDPRFVTLFEKMCAGDIAWLNQITGRSDSNDA